MTVHFVGAGPGARDLLTLRAADLLARCDVCLYAGSLIPDDVLALCRADAQRIDTARMTLDEIIDAIAAADGAGRSVVRLCSGDPSILSAVAEQLRRLDRLGIDYDVTPGVPAFAAASAILRRELTAPGVAQSVVLTRYAQRATPLPSGESLAAFAATGATLVLHLGVQAIDRIVEELRPHYGDACPVAVVAKATHPDEQVLRGTVGTIAGLVADAGIRRTAVIMVGPALADESFLESHLYSSGRDRSEH